MFTIYENLIDCLGRQGTPIKTKLTPEELAKALTKDEYIMLTGERNCPIRKPARVFAMLVAPDSKYSAVSEDFCKLLARVPVQTPAREFVQTPSAKGAPALLTEITIVAKDELSPHISKKIKQYRIDHPEVHLNIYPYKLFIICIPEHCLSIPHELMTEEETARVCDVLRTTPDKFPKICQSDAQAVWIGARAGMLVKILRHSETSGVSVAYRYCIK